MYIAYDSFLTHSKAYSMIHLMADEKDLWTATYGYTHLYSMVNHYIDAFTKYTSLSVKIMVYGECSSSS